MGLARLPHLKASSCITLEFFYCLVPGAPDGAPDDASTTSSTALAAGQTPSTHSFVLSIIQAIGLKRNALAGVPRVLGYVRSLQEIYLEDNADLEARLFWPWSLPPTPPLFWTLYCLCALCQFSWVLCCV